MIMIRLQYPIESPKKTLKENLDSPMSQRLEKLHAFSAMAMAYLRYLIIESLSLCYPWELFCEFSVLLYVEHVKYTAGTRAEC